MIRQSAPRRTAFSALNALEAIAGAITEIKAEDHLTDADIGAVLGKSEDMAAKYRTGLAAMDVVTFGRGKREWNGRFTGYFDRLCEVSRPAAAQDHAGQTSILAAACALSRALEDGEITPAEVQENRTVLEAAADALCAQLGKLRIVSEREVG